MSAADEPEAADAEAAREAVVSEEEGDEPNPAQEKIEEKKPGKLQQLLVEYGAIALVVHLSLFAITICGFAVAISAGWETDGAGEETGVWLAAYIASQLTKPIRIPLVVVLTPIVAAVWHRIRGKPPKGEASADAEASADDAKGD